MSSKKYHKKFVHHIKNTEINHDISQGSIILGILLFSFLIIWNYLEFFNSFVFLFIKLGSVLLIINIYMLYKQGKKNLFLMKKYYYDKYNWFKYMTYGVLLIFLLIIFIQLPSKEDLKKYSTEQLINLSKFNPIYFGENSSSFSDIYDNINFSSFSNVTSTSSNSNFFKVDECTRLVNEYIELTEIKSQVSVSGSILSSKIFSNKQDALNYAEKYASSSNIVGNDFCENFIGDIKTYIIQFSTSSPNAIKDKVTGYQFCGKINDDWKLVKDYKYNYQCK
jgi:hypothetical protein